MLAIILSGGKNLRMGGGEKAFLRIGSRSLIERKIEFLGSLFGRIIVVTNSPERYSGLGVEVVTDERSEMGPLMGLYCGLKNSETSYNFVTTCDTPFLQKPLIEYLKDAVLGFDAAVPRWNDKLEPLCAVYSRGCIEHIAKALETDRKVISFFDKVNVNYIPAEMVSQFDPEGLSFFNINTMADYKQALEIFQKKKPAPE